MHIAALSAPTKELLGSSLVIPTPVTLVKELLDNAIDAKATTVEITISPNTIDKIEVRDNGTGIHPDDYDSLGRRGHTSKLKTFEELRDLAGASLGFRGEALASVNAMAKVTVTTKTSSDPMAAVLHILPKTGGILRQQPAPAPVGTTVSITELYSQLPVRKQALIKEAAKSIERIKDILHSYVMARPQLKLSLRVLKTPTHNWTYSPKRDASVREAVLQLFGTAVAAQCLERTRSFNNSAIESVAVQPRHNGQPGLPFTLEAVMVKADAKSCYIPKRCYFSVDNRPIARFRGIVKKIMSIYSKYLSNADNSPLGAKLPSDFLFRLNIKCPPGTYDINIEPSKDDVLFEDEAIILYYVEMLCKELYGPLDICGQSVMSRTDHKTHLHPPDKADNIEGCRVPCSPSITRPGHTAECDQQSTTYSLEDNSRGAQIDFAETRDPVASSETENLPLEKTRLPNVPRISSGMSPDLDDRVDKNPGPMMQCKSYQPSIPTDDAVNAREVSLRPALDPWSICRNNAVHDLTEASATLAKQYEQFATQDKPSGLLSTPEPDMLCHQAAPPRDLDVPPHLRYNNIPSTMNCPSNSVPGNPYQNPKSCPPGPVLHGGHRLQKHTVSLRRRAQPPWTPPSSRQIDQKKWEGLYNLRSGPHPGKLKQTIISFEGHPSPQKSPLSQVTQGPAQAKKVFDSVRTASISFHDAFSTARQKLVEEYELSPQHQRVSTTLSPRPKTYRNPKKENESALLHSTNIRAMRNAEKAEPIRTSIPIGDPRAYLLRRQISMVSHESAEKPHRSRRMKSSLMPLENVPSDYRIHHFILPARINIIHLSDSMKHAEKYDQYVIEGIIEDALDIDPSEARRIEERVNALLSQWGEERTGERSEVESNFSTILRGGTARAQI